MKLWVVAAGKIKERALREVADEYVSRVRRYVRLEEVEVRDPRGLERAIPAGALLVTLEVQGRALSSEQFAQRLERWGSLGKGDVCFLIGGAEGIPRSCSQKADVQLSLSSMTLPHRLARVLLFEQIYRGLSILRGEPYAREG